MTCQTGLRVTHAGLIDLQCTEYHKEGNGCGYGQARDGPGYFSPDRGGRHSRRIRPSGQGHRDIVPGIPLQSLLDQAFSGSVGVGLSNEEGIDLELEIRVGIASGYCTVGNFGSETRMDYTLLGRVVNLASRLEHQADPGGIWVSNDTWILLKDEFEGEAQEPIQVKGFDKPVQPWKLLF